EGYVRPGAVLRRRRRGLAGFVRQPVRLPRWDREQRNTQEHPAYCLTSDREGHRHRSRDGFLRIRHRPPKRRAPQSHRPRVVENVRGGTTGGSAEDDLRRRGGAGRGTSSRCRRPRGIVRRRRRPHRSLHLPRARTAATEDRRLIARLRGRPVANTPEGLVVDVGGIGYLVAATPSAIRKADGADEVALHTYLHVREDVLQLYGFAEPV